MYLHFQSKKGEESHNAGFALGLKISKVLSCLKTSWILIFLMWQCKNFYKISSFNVCFQKIFSPKTIIGEASNCDQSIPHPFLGIHPNVLSSSTRLCGLWTWGFALRWWSRREEINRLCYNQFRPITPQVGFLVCPSTWLHTR